MIFTDTKLHGAFIVDVKLIEDVRGFFALTWSADIFESHGLESRVVQMNLSFNNRAGTLRGMHFQKEPHAQAKVVSCIRGSIYDVLIDLRPDSPTFKQWDSVELSASNHRMLYVPKGFAHGFQTLEDNTEVLYHMSDVYVPESASGVRWNDPAFAIAWPPAERTIIARDEEYPDFIA
jgi:dTDP-4-dehydrorhamnose 3,5-epimerase